ncbi:MAG: hypothetical protein Q8M91_06555 [Polaromonas sp.]|nr:hypothetical protein [Polaromonas sp.]MDP3607199.1 hypothetical protein [Polaromonas sp.]
MADKQNRHPVGFFQRSKGIWRKRAVDVSHNKCVDYWLIYTCLLEQQKQGRRRGGARIIAGPSVKDDAH